jgi:hypothetical protein
MERDVKRLLNPSDLLHGMVYKSRNDQGMIMIHKSANDQGMILLCGFDSKSFRDLHVGFKCNFSIALVRFQLNS